MLLIVIILFSKYSAVISLLCCACDSTRPCLYIISLTRLCLAVIRRAWSLRCRESPMPGIIDQLFHASARMTRFPNNCFSNIIMQQRETDPGRPRTISPCNQIRTYKAQPLTLSPQRQEPVYTPSPVLGTHICKRMLV